MKKVELGNVYFNLYVPITETMDITALKRSLREMDKVGDVSTIDGGNEISVQFILVDNIQHVDSRIKDAKKAIEKVLKTYMYRTANSDESREIYGESDKWFKDAPSASRFSDTKGIAMASVAEYIANQRGLTLYKLN